MFANPWKPVALALLLMIALLCAYDYLVTRAAARVAVQYFNEPIAMEGRRPVTRAEMLDQVLKERGQLQLPTQEAPATPHTKP
jgi:hypothetical protein